MTALAKAAFKLWPFRRGAGRIVDLYFSQIRFNETEMAVRTTDGFDMLVDPNELIGRHLYLTGEFDRSIVEALLKFAKPGDTLLDIGANIGYVSACLLHLIPALNVIAVEPNPTVRERLAHNLCQFGRNTVYPFAISDRNGSVHFDAPSSNHGAGRLVQQPTHRSIVVESRSGLRLFDELSIAKLDLVKIDAEGAELDIIRSCRSNFEKLRPRCILFEDSAGEMGKTELPAIFQAMQYQVFGLKKSLTKITLRRNTMSHDYVALPK